MAEYGAHITITANDKPSIFDVVAQETFLETFEPAFKHLLRIIAENNPAKYQWCIRYADEIYFSLHSLLQYHYLSNYGASFAENFYNLKRIPINKKYVLNGVPLKLHPKLIMRSLLALTVVPYVRKSLNNYFTAIEQERREGLSPEKSIKENLKSGFLMLWPKVHFLIQITTLYYYISFLRRRHEVHSPLLHLVGVYLAYLGEEDAEVLEERSKRLNLRNVRSLRELGWWAVESGGSVLQNSLEVGAFFLQFLDWFYSSESSSAQNLFGSSSLIPPPPPPPSNEEFLDRTQCPICLQTRKQETVLSVSGYVFCYPCILVYLRQHGKCPVTKYPATTKQLIKIYMD